MLCVGIYQRLALSSKYAAYRVGGKLAKYV